MQTRTLRAVAVGLIATVAVTLFGCATDQGADDAARPAANRERSAALPGKPGCFWLSSFNGSWTVLNDSELIVYAPLFSRPYLVRLFAPVPDLKFDQRLGFEDVERTRMICNGSMDYLLVPHWQSHRVPIVAVRKLTLPEERLLLVQSHIKLPPGSGPGKGNQGSAH